MGIDRLLGHSTKNWESGIWLKICKIICDSRNWDSTLPITPNFSRARIIGRNQIPILPENSRSPTHLPNYSWFFQNFPGAQIRLCLVRLFQPAMSRRRFCVGRRHGATPMHCYWQPMAKVNIVTTSLKVTLRKLVMKHIPITSMGDRVEDMIRMMRRLWETRGDTSVCFCGELAAPRSPIGDMTEQQWSAGANTWSIITKTDHQNSLPIIPDFSRVGNSR
jgi:hypothetical protein